MPEPSDTAKAEGRRGADRRQGAQPYAGEDRRKGDRRSGEERRGAPRQ